MWSEASRPDAMGLLKRIRHRIDGRLLGAELDAADVPTARLGTEYGAHAVCLERLDAGSVVYSAGVGEDISFDLALRDRCGATIYAFDPTPRSIEWVAAQDLGPSFVMHGYGLAGEDATLRFAPPTNPKHISHTLLDRPETQHAAIEVPVRRLSSVMEELGHDSLDVLKMDIEGAEYDVIDEIVDAGIDVDQILVEFHHFFRNVRLAQTKRAMERLRGAGYRLFAVSDTCREMSFIRA